MDELSIGEVARRAGISTSAIRYYEGEGLLPRPRRRSGRRVYGPEVMVRLRLVELAKQAGFTIPEIRRLLGGFARGTPPGQRWRALADRKLAELDERSRNIVAQRWLAENKATLHELADEYGVSAERIRQLEANAMKKLKTALAA